MLDGICKPETKMDCIAPRQTQTPPNALILSLCRITPIDHQVAAGDEGGFLRSEEENGVSDLARLGDELEDMSAAPVGMGVGGRPVHAFFARQALNDLRPDGSRAHGIDANIIRR